MKNTLIHILKMRPSRNETFMEVAFAISKRSTCKRLQVGCVVVRDGMILGTGYNGVCKGEKHCEKDGCNMIDGHCSSIHSEENAIINCAYNGVSTKGANIYCTHIPCDRCTMRLINAGIINVFYLHEYRSKEKKFHSPLINFQKVFPRVNYEKHVGVGSINLDGIKISIDTSDN